MESALIDRRLLLFKWLMVAIPPSALVLGHSALWLAVGDHAARETLLVTGFVAVPAFLLAYLFAAAMFRVLRRLQADALAREQEIRTLSAVMEERERLSRELHDGAAQLISHLMLRLDTIRDLVARERREEADAELEQLRGVANEVYEDIGQSITGLRTNVAERGLIRALQDLVETFEERHRIPVTLQAEAAADRLSPLAAFQLFRVVQEALTNVRKHAGAGQAWVTVAAIEPDLLTATIADDGRGFDRGSQDDAPGRPLGLTSMRERVVSLGGTLEVTSAPGSGTQVVATIPLAGARTEHAHGAVAAAAR